MIYDVFANLVVRRSFFDFPESVNVVRYPALKPGMLRSTRASPAAITASVELFDRGVAEHLDQVFATDLSNATQLTPAECERRGTVAKLTERLLAPLRPLL